MKTISTGYKDISVEIIDYNQKLAEHTWNCYRMTWKNLQNKEYDINDNDVRKAISDVMNMRALPMPRKQAIITFRINNISRVCLAQITRQTGSCFNVESQMPRPITHNVIMPRNIANSKHSTKAEQLIKLSQELYDELIADGIPPQDARYMTMHGQTTSLVYVTDIDTFVRSFGQRCDNNLSDEINLVYRLCLSELKTKLYYDFKNTFIDELTFSMYRHILRGADVLGAKQHVSLNYDKVFGNSFERYPAGNELVKKATDECDYDYKKSAWYFELIEIYKHRPYLLFDDEKEMIEKWLNEKK